MGKKKNEKKSKRKCTIEPLERFKQQDLHYTIVVMTPCPLATCFMSWGIVALFIGIIFTVSSIYPVDSGTFRYDNLCPLGDVCQFRFELEEDMDKPVYLYFRMENYYQNQRDYKDSFSSDQLANRLEDNNDYDVLVGACGSRTSEDDEDSDDKVYLPCGKVPFSFFNDTFHLLKDNGDPVDQSRADVNWMTDEILYEDPGASTAGIRVVNSYENPNFMVWMRVAALPSFLKLYAIIDEDLPKGLYRMRVKNNYPVHEFDGMKMFRLSTTTWIGNQKYFLGGFHLVAGAVLVGLAVVVFLKANIWPRKLGNVAYLNWGEY